MNRQNLHNAVHMLILLILIYVVFLYVTNNILLEVDNYFFRLIKYLTTLTLYKVIIISFSQINQRADIYISLLYLLFAALFINLHLATKKHRDIYLQNLAFYNWHSFSGVLGFHIYNLLLPRVHLDFRENYSIFKSEVSNKKLDTFLVEQLSNKGTHSYLSFMFLTGFVALPIGAISLIDVIAVRVISFWFVCLLMVYIQIKTIFEVFLIYKAWKNSNKDN